MRDSPLLQEEQLVSQRPEEVKGEVNVITGHVDDDEVLVVMTVVKLHDSLLEFYGLNAWKTMAEGNPIKFKYHSKNFENAQLMWNLHWWPLRSTLIRRQDGDWELVEHCSRYYTFPDPGAEIPECAGEETQVLTILHRKREPVQCFGTIVGERTATAGGANVQSSDFLFETEPPVPDELRPENQVTEEELDQHDSGEAWDGPLPSV